MFERKTIKRRLPGILRSGLEGLRAALNGPGIEADVLGDTPFVPDLCSSPRVTLIMPDLRASTAYGGVMTALSIFVGIWREVSNLGIDCRIVSEAKIDPIDCVLNQFPELGSIGVTSLEGREVALPLRANEICVVYNWWISMNLSSALADQARYFEQDIKPKVYLIQDYEPQFYPFSAAHILAQEALSSRKGLWCIFNTSELHDYWRTQGHEAEKVFVFEPKLNPSIRTFVDGITPQDKTRKILVYARPSVPRNAFFLVRRGLEEWSKNYGVDHPDWDIFSAGMPHGNIELGGGHILRSLGKLSLEEYAKLLRETAIGISFMVSPHPSYPPLEMAHFGARVLTNSYLKKGLSMRHDNLIALQGVHPMTISRAIESEVNAFEGDPSIGLEGKNYMPDFLTLDEGGWMSAFAAELQSALCVRRPVESGL